MKISEDNISVESQKHLDSIQIEIIINEESIVINLMEFRRLLRVLNSFKNEMNDGCTNYGTS